MDRQTCGTVEVYEVPACGRRFQHGLSWRCICAFKHSICALTVEPVTLLHFLNLIGITSKGYLYTYMISTTVGYTIAFILNRKITFNADANPAVSMMLYAVMVLFTIFANGWIGSAMTTWARENDLTGNLCDMAIKVIGMLIPMLWTYPCNRFLIHRKKKRL